MQDLNGHIKAYLSINNIPYQASDYTTGQPEGQEDQILYWNTEALGAVPTTEQLDAAWAVYIGEQIQAENKSQATALLQQTDWTTIPDVADPALSDPYLTNAAEFAAYRSNVRKIAVNPPTTPAVFPVMPDEIWSE